MEKQAGDRFYTSTPDDSKVHACEKEEWVAPELEDVQGKGMAEAGEEEQTHPTDNGWEEPAGEGAPLPNMPDPKKASLGNDRKEHEAGWAFP